MLFMNEHIETSFTRGEGFLRAVIFLRVNALHTDAPMAVVFCSGEKEHIFIPAPSESMTDPVYPEKSSGQFVHRIEKGIYCATLFGTKQELDLVRKIQVFANGEEAEFEV